MAKSTQDKQLSRRSLMEWLGAGSLLALADLAAACRGTESHSAPGGGQLGGGGQGGSAAACEELPFSPGDETGSIYGGWNVRTVDSQNAAALVASWSLTLDGLVGAARELSFADLLALPCQQQVTDFHCVEGWSVYDIPWTGVHLSTLLDLVQPAAAATHLTLHCVGGTYLESLPLDVALEERTMLAYGIDGSALPLAHGFPARLVVPRKFGYKNAKYVERIELSAGPVEGYWESFGYGYDADVQSDRLRPGKY